MTPENVMRSAAAEVVGGRNVVESGMATGIVYDFDRPAAQCCIGLSVMDGTKVEPEPDVSTWLPAVEGRIKALVAKCNEELLLELTKVYNETLCMICMDAARPPDAIFYQCGHQCCHISCTHGSRVSFCPLCGKYISVVSGKEPSGFPGYPGGF